MLTASKKYIRYRQITSGYIRLFRKIVSVSHQAVITVTRSSCHWIDYIRQHDSHHTFGFSIDFSPSWLDVSTRPGSTMTSHCCYVTITQPSFLAPERIEHHFAVLASLCKHGLAPSNLSTKLQRKADMESTHSTELDVPRTQNKKVRVRAFSVDAMRVWNSLLTALTLFHHCRFSTGDWKPNTFCAHTWTLNQQHCICTVATFCIFIFYFWTECRQ